MSRLHRGTKIRFEETSWAAKILKINLTFLFIFVCFIYVLNSRVLNSITLWKVQKEQWYIVPGVLLLCIKEGKRNESICARQQKCLFLLSFPQIADVLTPPPNSPWVSFWGLLQKNPKWFYCLRGGSTLGLVQVLLLKFSAERTYSREGPK